MIDLHIHSKYSDGSLNLEEIIEEAKKLKLKAISITDHDNAMAARNLNDFNFPFKFVNGIEISVQYDNNLRLHLLGLFIDVFSDETFKLEKEQITLREERNLEIFEKLKKIGYEIDYREVKEKGKFATGNLHFAEVLVEKGYFKDIEEAKEKLLRKGKPAYVEKKRISVIEGVERINDAKGVPIIAHIGKEIKYIKNLEEVLKDLKEKGVEGIEVYHSDHSAEMSKFLKVMAKKYSFLVSGGSDFHGKNKEGAKIGIGMGNLKIPYQVYEDLRNYWKKKFY